MCLKPDDFVDLHTHSTYSFLDGMGTPEQIAARVHELGQLGAGLTDHGNIFGHVDFYHALKAKELKPILGMEAYLVQDVKEKGEKKESADKQKKGKARAEYSHITVLAANATGYQNLLKLSTISYEYKYYVPRIDWELLARHQEGLVVLSGCVIGQLSKWILAGKEDVAFAQVEWLRQHIENFYIEIVPCPDLDLSTTSCPVLWKIARELALPVVFTSDAHFPRPDDWKTENAMVAISTGHAADDPERPIRLPAYHYRCPVEDIYARAKACLPEAPEEEICAAIRRSRDIADLCNVELPKSSGPIFQVPHGFDADSLLVKWIEEGKAYRRSLGLLPDLDTILWRDYLEREAYELDIIRHFGFQNYFLIVADLVRWSNGRGHWCIARGSCGGSLLCWYLQISQVDPVNFDLPVERFIDKTRPELPDIDLDFDSRYRDDAFSYLEAKYGKENCAHIANLSRFRAKQAIADVANAFGLPQKAAEELRALVPEATDADEGIKATGVLKRLFETNEKARALLAKYPDFAVAAEIEGQCRQSSVHACGFVVDSRPLDQTCALLLQADGTRVVSVDKEAAPQIGLLKIDVLSVDRMTAISETLEMIGWTHDDLYRLPLDDAKTYELLCKGFHIGVHQLQGQAAGRLLLQVQPQNFDDFMSISALARPGPLQSGGAEDFVRRRRGLERLPAYHPIIDRIVGKTLGVILYQEQVMRLGWNVGNFPTPDVHKLRKLISKSGGKDAIAPYEPAYLEGAKANGIPQEEAVHFWEQAEKAGNYLFNQAHNCQYALIGYWCAYLKAHYPAEFTCASARLEGGDPKKKTKARQELLREYQQFGGKVKLLDPNRSKRSFEVLDKETILGGFQNLQGCGPAFTVKLLEQQPFESWEQFYEAVPTVIREKVRRLGLETGVLDTDLVLTLAPWFPSVTFLDFELKEFKKHKCNTIGSVLNCLRAGQNLTRARLLGRMILVEESDMFVAAKKYGRKAPKAEARTRATVTLADPTGSITVSVNAKQWHEFTTKADILRGEHGGVGNTVLFDVSYHDKSEKFYVEDAKLIRQRRN